MMLGNVYENKILFYIDVYFDIYTVKLYELILKCSLKDCLANNIKLFKKKCLTILTTTVTHPIDNYKKQVENAEAFLGVEWLHKVNVISRKNSNFQAEDVKSSNKRRIREVSYLWYEECYKFGEKQVKKNAVKG